MTFRQRLSAEEFQELVRPKLKLFLSVDVVGSTEYKQERDHKRAQHWLSFFVNFYASFPTLLKAALESGKGPVSTMPRLWKALGDELVFTAELTNRREAAVHVRAFRQALCEAVRNWRRDSCQKHDLLIKGTAWLAGFPVGNAEIPLQSADKEDEAGRDYIGPQVDVGFRLKDHATPRKLILSADLALLMLSAGKPGLKFYFDGDQALKGVIRGRPYPLVWVDCDDSPSTSRSIHVLKDRLLDRKPAASGVLKEYLRKWISQTKGLVPMPFIVADLFDGFRKPADYEVRRKDVVRELSRLFLQEGRETDQGSDKVPDELAAFMRRRM